MSEQKKRMSTRSSKQIQAQPKHQQVQKQAQIVKNKSRNPGQKRPLQQKSLLTMFLKKQQNEIIAQPIQVLSSIKQILKTTTINDIILNCPKVKMLYQLLCAKLYSKQKLLIACLDKYFHGNTTSLWYNKYAPRQFNQLFQSDFAQKIEEWIKDFYYFRKESSLDPQSDFINDQSQQSCSKSLQLRMRQYGWNCRALVLRGRNGVGKTSLLNAVCKSMNIRCFQYASDVDQLQKMREMTDGSQSQCVDKYQNKKKQQQNNKIIKQNNFITKFMPICTKKQSLETKQPKRMQIFRNFNNYYPPSDKLDIQNAEDNYFRQLFQKINKSPVPYVLTTSKDEFIFRQKNLNQKFYKFDQLEFIQNSVDDLSYLYWVIYQIQSNLRLNSAKKIPKAQLFNQINEQLKNFQIKLTDNLHLIRQLVKKSNKKPLYVSKYLQFCVHMPISTTQTSQKQNIDLNKLNSSYLQNAIKQIGSQIIHNISSDDLINNMQWQIYQKALEEPTPFEQTADSQSCQNSVKSEQKILQDDIKRPNLKQTIKRLNLKVAQDRKVFQNQYYCFQDQTSPLQSSSLNQDIFFQIPTDVHLKAKKKLFKNIKSNLNSIHSQKQKWQKKCQVFKMNMNEKQLYYLPLVFVSNGSRRASRSLYKTVNKQTTQQNLAKLMTPRQLQYLRKFGKYVLIE